MIPHSWDLSANDAIALQHQLAAQVDTSTPLKLDRIRYVAGVDCSVKDKVSRAAIVVMSYPELEIVETATEAITTPFPYIPGLLTFREGEVILKAHAKLEIKPDVYIFDGQGIMHPRRLGIAAHIGLWLQKPSVGCGKSRLIGKHDTLGAEKGNTTPIIDRGETVGMLVRTRTRVKPVYISVGHKTTLDTSVQLILNCTTCYKLPEPIRAADHLAGQF